MPLGQLFSAVLLLRRRTHSHILEGSPLHPSRADLFTPNLALVARTGRSYANNLDMVCEKTESEWHTLFSSGAAQLLETFDEMHAEAQGLRRYS